MKKTYREEKEMAQSYSATKIQRHKVFSLGNKKTSPIKERFD